MYSKEEVRDLFLQAVYCHFTVHLFFTGISCIRDLRIPERGVELGACPVALPLNLYATN
jgi:hypothetical protein